MVRAQTPRRRSDSARRGSQRGLTLVEMSVALTVNAILVLAAAALGTAWSNNAKVSQAQTSLQRAFSVAKGVALENPLQQRLTNTAAIVCFNNGQITVYAATTCNGTAVWQATFPTGVAVLFGSPTPNTTPTCIALTNTGAPTAGAGGCTTTLSYAISKGSAYVATNSLY